MTWPLAPGLGQLAGKVFRIGHLGSLTDAMALSGLATAEMVMADLGLPIRLGLGRRRGAGTLPPLDRGRPAKGRLRMRDAMYIPTLDDMLVARARIAPAYPPHAGPDLALLNELTGAELFFKCENLQKAGAFKARGASNAVFGLSDEQAARGVATHSSGNHGTCLSYAAGRRGIPCTVVMPRTAPQAKKDAVRGYGGGWWNANPRPARARRSLPRSWPRPAPNSSIPITTGG
jgi:hypothetical protein